MRKAKVGMRGKKANCLYPMRTKYHPRPSVKAMKSQNNHADRRRAARLDILDRRSADIMNEIHNEALVMNTPVVKKRTSRKKV